MKISDADRDLAAELVELLAGEPNERDARTVAVILASHRASDRLRPMCGEMSPYINFANSLPLVRYRCEVEPGHAGPHQSTNGGQLTGLATWDAISEEGK